MKRFRSRVAQFACDARNRVHLLSKSSHLSVRLAAKFARRLFTPLLKSACANRLVSAQLYGRSLIIPAEHSLPLLLIDSPQYNLGLGLAAEVIASSPSARPSMIDVGANVGETVAIVESHVPNRYLYLCLEPDPEIAVLCQINHENTPRVQVERCFVGEHEGTTVRLQDDGRANPSTVLSQEEARNGGTSGKLLRLDTIAANFAARNGGVDLLKIDTEGYDFSVLRSAPKLLTQYHPALYFEWFPALLLKVGETVSGGFQYLAEMGYRHFVFFTSTGHYYCHISDPDELLLLSLSAVASADPSMLYFDVFASTELAVCNALVEKSIRALRTGEPEAQLGSTHCAAAQECGVRR